MICVGFGFDSGRRDIIVVRGLVRLGCQTVVCVCMALVVFRCQSIVFYRCWLISKCPTSALKLIGSNNNERASNFKREGPCGSHADFVF